MTNMPRIFTDPKQSKLTVEIVADMDTLEDKLTNMPDVKTEEEAEVVSEYRAQFKAKARDLDKERKEMTAGARATVAMLNDKYRVIIERADRCTQLADNKLLPYMQEQERIRLEEERKAREAEAARKKAEADAAAAKAEAERIAKETKDAEALKEAEAEVTKARETLDEISKTPAVKARGKSTTGVLGSQTGLRKVWKYEIEDFSKVPEEWLIPPEERLDKGKLNTVAKRDQENAYVPGIRFYCEDTLASRAGVRK